MLLFPSVNGSGTKKLNGCNFVKSTDKELFSTLLRTSSNTWGNANFRALIQYGRMHQMLKIDTIAGKGHQGENWALNIAVQAEIYILYTQQIGSFI